MRKLGERVRLAFSSGPAFLFLRLFCLGFCGSYRLRTPELEWFDDAAFNEFLTRFGERRGLNADRRWMLYQLLRAIGDIDGDTAECGVFRGASSYLICAANAAGRKPRTHHLFDSFAGLSAPDPIDGSHWRQHDLRYDLEKVRASLSRFTALEYHPGWIPDRFSDVENRRFCFVHIDVDLYAPTRDSIRFFYPRLSPGGIVVCDDYGFASCPGATQAIDEYLADKPERMIGLSDGGGFLIRGMVVSDPAPIVEGTKG